MDLNTYETTDPPGLDVDGLTTWLTGANGRRIAVRDDADGLYIGGVLIDPDHWPDAYHLAAILRKWSLRPGPESVL